MVSLDLDKKRLVGIDIFGGGLEIAIINSRRVIARREWRKNDSLGLPKEEPLQILAKVVSDNNSIVSYSCESKRLIPSFLEPKILA